jgi:hypothetical protein
MASTRNLNTPGDYALEQNRFAHQFEFRDYNTSSFVGVAYNTMLPGDGLVGMRADSRVLSRNYCDIETQLFGIGSTNLVHAKAAVVPEVYKLDTQNLTKKMPSFMPNDPTGFGQQRYMYLS